MSIVEGNTVYFRSFIDGTFLGEIEKLTKIANRVAMEENTGANIEILLLKNIVASDIRGDFAEFANGSK